MFGKPLLRDLLLDLDLFTTSSASAKNANVYLCRILGYESTKRCHVVSIILPGAQNADPFPSQNREDEPLTN